MNKRKEALILQIERDLEALIEKHGGSDYNYRTDAVDTWVSYGSVVVGLLEKYNIQPKPVKTAPGRGH